MQVKAYEQIQRSIQGLSPSSHSPSGLRTPSPRPPPSHGTPTQGMPIPGGPRRAGSNTSLASIGSMSPPTVQFTIGTPPSNVWRRHSNAGAPLTVCAGTAGGGSPLKRQPPGRSHFFVSFVG